MKVQIYLIAILSSLILWSASFDVSRTVYREAHQAGLMPNLELRHHFHAVVTRTLGQEA